MKKLKYILALLVLTSLINGCGAPTSSKIIEKMFETEISSASIDVHIDIDLDADVDDEDVTSIIKTDLQILAQDIRNRDDVIVNITGTSNVIIFGDEYQNKEAIDIYYKGDNSQELYYFYSDDNKYYIYPNNIINGIEVDKDKNKKIKKSLNNICKKAKVGKKLETFNGEACYSLEIIPTSKQHEEIINIFLSLIGIEDDERDIYLSQFEEKYGLELQEVLEKLNITNTLYVSKENNYLVGFKIGIDETSIDDLIDDINDTGLMEISDVYINSFDVEVTFSEINNIDIDIPASLDEADKAPLSSMNINKSPDEGKYDEASHSFSLYDDLGYKICELKVPKECDVVYEYEDMTSVSVAYYTDYFSMLHFSARTDSTLERYVLFGIEPDDAFYKYYKCECDRDEVNGIEIYKIYLSYMLMDSSREAYYILVPYYDSLGTKSTFQIEINEEFYNNWDNGAKSTISYLFRKAKSGKVDSFIERDFSINGSTLDNGGELYNEQTGEFTLYSNVGYQLETFSIPDGYYMDKYEADGSYYLIINNDKTIDFYDRRIGIYNKTDINLIDYLLEGKTVVDENEKLNKLHARIEKLGDYTCFIVDYSYGSNVIKRHQVLIEYSTYSGEHDFIAIDLSEGMMNNWDNGTKDIILDILNVPQ